MPPFPSHLTPTSWAWLLCCAVLGLAWWIASSRIRRGNHRRARVARHAEEGAERLLTRRGYAIEDRQVTRTFDLDVGGQIVEVWCRADMVVRKRGRRYVAEVKSGSHADARHPHVRRQLLEYLLAFDVDGVLLIDMARGQVVEVGFPWLRRARRRSWAAAL